MWKDKGLKIVMLSSSNKENGLRGYSDKSLLFNYRKDYRTVDSEGGFTCYYHLYLLSDEEPRDGDMCLDGEYIFGPYEEGDIAIDDKFIKIIACNDPSLNLPQFPDSFLEEYVKRYNSKQPMEVEVDYMYNFISSNKGKIKFEELNLNNNTISIRFKEDKIYNVSWKELSAILNLGMTIRQDQLRGHFERSGNEILADWIEENLK